MGDPVETVRRYHAAINALDYAALDVLFAEDAAYFSHGIGAVRGKDAILRSFRTYFAEYGNQVAVDDIVEGLSGLQARSLWRLTATSAVTGMTSSRQGEEVVSLDDTGKILRVDVRDW